MPFRTDIDTKVAIDGEPYSLVLIDNPTIEDVLVVEMKLKAAEIVTGASDPARRVERDVRDVLLRLGVER